MAPITDPLTALRVMLEEVYGLLWRLGILDTEEDE